MGGSLRRAPFNTAWLKIVQVPLNSRIEMFDLDRIPFYIQDLEFISLVIAELKKFLFGFHSICIPRIQR
jgi:hypothetical protein